MATLPSRTLGMVSYDSVKINEKQNLPFLEREEARRTPWMNKFWQFCQLLWGCLCFNLLSKNEMLLEINCSRTNLPQNSCIGKCTCITFIFVSTRDNFCKLSESKIIAVHNMMLIVSILETTWQEKQLGIWQTCQLDHVVGRQGQPQKCYQVFFSLDQGSICWL